MRKRKAVPLVSVIIPAYNHEKYIQETILSIINQTYKNIELLIIDDGSSDTTYDKICEIEIRCRKRFVRFEFGRQQNLGIIDTLNKLLDNSIGEYVFLIASDDVAAPHAIEAELDFLVNNTDYALCVGSNDIIDGNSRRCFWDYNKNNVYDAAKAEYFSFSDFLIQDRPNIDFFSDDFGSYYNLIHYSNHIPNGYLIRKSIFKKTGYFIKEAPLEDYWIMMQIAKYAKMKHLRDTLFYYRWHEKNTMINLHGPYYNYKTLLQELRNNFRVEKLNQYNEEFEISPEELEVRMKEFKNIFNLYFKE